MFLIKLQGKESIYEQIRSQITLFIEKGILQADDKLPSVRSLANDLGINPNTVQKAYSQLEEDGLIYTLNKKGVFVKAAVKEHNLEDVSYIIKSFRDKGISRKEIENIVDMIYGDENETSN